MPEARSKKTFTALAGALIAAALVVAPLVTAGASAAKPSAEPVSDWPADTVGTKGQLVPWTNDNNHADFWESYVQDGDSVVCYDGQSSAHGKLTDGGLTVTLESFNQAWEGDHWELLVIKAGSKWNDVIVHPQAGVAYASPPNSGGRQAQVSHWTVCKGKTPDDQKPEQPKPLVTEKNETLFSCEDKVAVVKKTITTTAYDWDETLKKWVLGTPVVGEPVETQRLLTDAELETCPKPSTEETTPWVDGQWVCGDTTVTQTRTVTTKVDGVVTDTKTETRVRGLEQHEIGTCPLVPGDIAASCVGDVPYLSYDVALPEGFNAPNATPLTIVFEGKGGQTWEQQSLPLSGKLLWPGASDEQPKMWPGWALVDGEYVQTDGNFAWTRAGVTVHFKVNPEYETTVDYPAATALCANPLLTDEDPEPTPTPTQTPTVTPTPTATPAVVASGDLAVTGGGVSPVLVAAGAATLVAGIAVATVAAYRRRRSAAE